jgi:imidazole glycerol-phosphate synthase subunit HisF
MVKKRLIPVLNILNGQIVRSEDFSVHQIIGNVINEAKRYDEWNVDELIYLDISRTKNYDSGRDDHKVKAYLSLEEILLEVSKICFMPLTFGGGIRSLEQVEYLISNGADKVVLNTGAFENNELVKQTAASFGSQAVVISIDYKMKAGVPVVFTNFGQKDTGMDVYGWIKECEKLGAGEIFLNSIDLDGRGIGYDIETIGRAVESTSLPVIACGGAGDLSDFTEVIKQTNAAAIAAGNIFHFTERSYPRAKQQLIKNGVHVRA